MTSISLDWFGRQVGVLDDTSRCESGGTHTLSYTVDDGDSTVRMEISCITREAMLDSLIKDGGSFRSCVWMERWKRENPPNPKLLQAGPVMRDISTHS